MFTGQQGEGLASLVFTCFPSSEVVPGVLGGPLCVFLIVTTTRPVPQAVLIVTVFVA